MRMLEVFAGSQSMAACFRSHGWEVVTVDIHQYRGFPQLTHCVDVLEWDYQAYQPGYFDFVWFGLPCTAFSKASGGFHFKDHRFPKTAMALTSIKFIERCFDIVSYFKFPLFFLENPAGGLCNNWHWRNNPYFSLCNVYRCSLSSFGFPTQKKTDLFTNLDYILLTEQTYRCNGRYQKTKFDNLSTHQRQKYPAAFCEYIFESIKPHFEKTSSGAAQ